MTSAREANSNSRNSRNVVPMSRGTAPNPPNSERGPRRPPRGPMRGTLFASAERHLRDAAAHLRARRPVNAPAHAHHISANDSLVAEVDGSEHGNHLIAYFAVDMYRAEHRDGLSCDFLAFPDGDVTEDPHAIAVRPVRTAGPRLVLVGCRRLRHRRRLRRFRGNRFGRCLEQGLANGRIQVRQPRMSSASAPTRSRSSRPLTTTPLTTIASDTSIRRMSVPLAFGRRPNALDRGTTS